MQGSVTRTTLHNHFLLHAQKILITGKTFFSACEAMRNGECRIVRGINPIFWSMCIFLQNSRNDFDQISKGCFTILNYVINFTKIFESTPNLKAHPHNHREQVGICLLVLNEFKFPLRKRIRTLLGPYLQS